VKWKICDAPIRVSLITFLGRCSGAANGGRAGATGPWGGGSSGSTVGRDDFHIKYFVYIKKKENKRRKIC